MKYFYIITGYIIVVFTSNLVIPDNIQYSKDGNIILIPFSLYSFIIPIFSYIIIKVITRKKDLAVGISLAMVIGGLTGYISSDYYRHYLIDKEFNDNSETTIGIISEKWYYNSTSAGYNGWQVRCSFLIDGNNYKTFAQNINDLTYQVGDTVTIKYLPYNPEINRVLEFYEFNK